MNHHDADDIYADPAFDSDDHDPERDHAEEAFNRRLMETGDGELDEPPLVAGGQGRSGASVHSDARLLGWIFLLLAALLGLLLLRQKG